MVAQLEDKNDFHIELAQVIFMINSTLTMNVTHNYIYSLALLNSSLIYKLFVCYKYSHFTFASRDLRHGRFWRKDFLIWIYQMSCTRKVSVFNINDIQFSIATTWTWWTLKKVLSHVVSITRIHSVVHGKFKSILSSKLLKVSLIYQIYKNLTHKSAHNLIELGRASVRSA